MALAFGLPLRMHSQPSHEDRAARQPLPELQQFAPIWSSNLDQQLSSATSQEQAIQGNLPVPLQLTGTLGPGQALVTRNDGTVQAVGVGENVDGVEIVDVGSGQMTVRYQGRLSKLTKPQEPVPMGGIQ